MVEWIWLPNESCSVFCHRRNAISSSRGCWWHSGQKICVELCRAPPPAPRPESLRSPVGRLNTKTKPISYQTPLRRRPQAFCISLKDAWEIRQTKTKAPAMSTLSLFRMTNHVVEILNIYDCRAYPLLLRSSGRVLCATSHFIPAHIKSSSAEIIAGIPATPSLVADPFWLGQVLFFSVQIDGESRRPRIPPDLFSLVCPSNHVFTEIEVYRVASRCWTPTH
ncbi:hypothetical protein PoB_000999100 [Plakobranchus ocellatus]|uniref:Uncharacterized protein n=1 Tax=Plakobranchus ocellatus TaxID=259542 RepID=A0AAV3YM56_9GAST|nr:hypothetical protein PoB_000999100 [Plakobranchus ocellatus]